MKRSIEGIESNEVIEGIGNNDDSLDLRVDEDDMINATIDIMNIVDNFSENTSVNKDQNEENEFKLSRNKLKEDEEESLDIIIDMDNLSFKKGIF